MCSWNGNNKSLKKQKGCLKAQGKTSGQHHNWAEYHYDSNLSDIDTGHCYYESIASQDVDFLFDKCLSDYIADTKSDCEIDTSSTRGGDEGDDGDDWEVVSPSMTTLS